MGFRYFFVKRTFEYSSPISDDQGILFEDLAPTLNISLRGLAFMSILASAGVIIGQFVMCKCQPSVAARTSVRLAASLAAANLFSSLSRLMTHSPEIRHVDDMADDFLLPTACRFVNWASMLGTVLPVYLASAIALYLHISFLATTSSTSLSAHPSPRHNRWWAYLACSVLASLAITILPLLASLAKGISWCNSDRQGHATLSDQAGYLSYAVLPWVALPVLYILVVVLLVHSKASRACSRVGYIALCQDSKDLPAMASLDSCARLVGWPAVHASWYAIFPAVRAAVFIAFWLFATDNTADTLLLKSLSVVNLTLDSLSGLATGIVYAFDPASIKARVSFYSLFSRTTSCPAYDIL
ncbi:hypothetical protein EV182_004405 [Spiromyces aspiralis]|uniref:Uncharacterized protein n=1 Tax=Spiromyces aspiralis TaxID=68401 RepID=A0ACC1HV86_9FUNG|nr:hypothetical protein EV182_004405 [Spiromyces aspiralis]